MSSLSDSDRPALPSENQNMLDENQQNPQELESHPQSPKSLTLELPNSNLEEAQDPENPVEENQIPDDPEPMQVLSPRISGTPTSVYRRAPKRKKTQKQRLAREKSQKKLEVLVETLKPIPFVPSKTLDFQSHEKLLRRLGLWDFVHIEFDKSLRADLLAELIANYSPQMRCSYVKTVRINLNRADLARALKLPSPAKKSVVVLDESEEDAGSGAESVVFVEDFLSNWVLLHEDTWMMPNEVLNWTKVIREGHLEKVDWASLVWFMVEKELMQAPMLTNCYYASHLQHLIKSQREELLKEEPKVEEMEAKEEDVDGSGDVRMVEVEEFRARELEKPSIGLCVDLSLGQGNLEKVEENVERVEEKVKRIEDKVEKAEDEVETVDEKVERVEDKVETGDGRVETGEEKVERVEEKVETGEETVERVEEKVETGEEKVERLDEKVETVDEKVETVEEKVETVNENVERVEEMLEEVERKVETIEEKLERVEEKAEIVPERVEVEDAIDIDDDVEKEHGGNENVMDFEECREEYKEQELGGQWLFDRKNNIGDVAESFLRPCSVGEDKVLSCEEGKREEGEEGQEEEEEEGDGEGEGEEEEEELEEEDDDDDEERGREVSGFHLSPKIIQLEGLASGSLIHPMETEPMPFSTELELRDHSAGEFLSSRDDSTMLPGGSLHFGNSNKRVISHENDNIHNSLNGANKRLRSDGPWDGKSSDFDMCMGQMQHWFEKARMMYATKEQACEEASMNQQILLEELQQRARIIEHLRATFEEQQKSQTEAFRHEVETYRHEVFRLERELFMMGSVLKGYRETLKEMHRAFSEYRVRHPQPEEPLYKDVPESGGLVLSTNELEKQRLKREEEERLIRLMIEKKIKDFEGAWIGRFEAHFRGVDFLGERLVGVENGVKLVKESFARRKVSDITDEASEIPDGGPEIPDGGPEIPDEAPEIPDGAPEIPDGAPEIPDGGPEIPDGAPEIADGGPEIADGAPEIPDRASEIPDGAPSE